MSERDQYFCNKCGSMGYTSEHANCNYLSANISEYARILARQGKRIDPQMSAIIKYLVNSPLAHHDYPHRFSCMDDPYLCKSCKPIQLKVDTTVICANWKHLSHLWEFSLSFPSVKDIQHTLSGT